MNQALGTDKGPLESASRAAGPQQSGKVRRGAEKCRRQRPRESTGAAWAGCHGQGYSEGQRVPGQESEFYSEGTGEPLKVSEQRRDITNVNLHSEAFASGYHCSLALCQPMAYSRWILAPPQAPSSLLLGQAPDLAVSEPCRSWEGGLEDAETPASLCQCNFC